MALRKEIYAGLKEKTVFSEEPQEKHRQLHSLMIKSRKLAMEKYNELYGNQEKENEEEKKKPTIEQVTSQNSNEKEKSSGQLEGSPLKKENAGKSITITTSQEMKNETNPQPKKKARKMKQIQPQPSNPTPTPTPILTPAPTPAPTQPPIRLISPANVGPRGPVILNLDPTKMQNTSAQEGKKMEGAKPAMPAMPARSVKPDRPNRSGMNGGNQNVRKVDRSESNPAPRGGNRQRTRP